MKIQEEVFSPKDIKRVEAEIRRQISGRNNSKPDSGPLKRSCDKWMLRLKKQLIGFYELVTI